MSSNSITIDWKLFFCREYSEIKYELQENM